MNNKLIFIISILILGLILYFFGRSIWIPVAQKFTGKRTTDDIAKIYGERARSATKVYFTRSGIDYPPKKITLLAMKQEQKVELWASNGDDQFSFIHTYKIQKLSGILGPKLREGDGQVPEGLYRIIGLNPNSSYHLSMKINYPNEFDLEHAKQEGRTEPGTNIFIHGKAVSIGCLAMGDKTIEELFLLVKDVGIENTEVIIAPYDPRLKALQYDEKTMPVWIQALYENITTKFDQFKHPPLAQ